jgi:predicted ATPase
MAQFARAPLVGRGVELDALVDTLSRARTRREPQLVTLVGVPGIGKSRLVWELFRHVDAQQQFVTWRQGRSLPYGDGVSFWALGEIVKAQAGVLESDSAEVATEKLGQSIANLLADEGERAWLEAHLRPLLGLGEEHTLHPDRQREAFAAWRRFLAAVAEQGPAVLVFEDLHWADDALLDFVDELLEWLSDVPLLVVATARPELLTRRPRWAGGKVNALTLSLAPLAEDEVVELVDALLVQPLPTAADRQTLVERAEGNPLYAEEFARLATERGGDITLPETVQGMIAARLDTLSGEEKQVLQNAAVIGKVFWTGGAQALTGMPRWTLEELLHGLERKEFVRGQRRSSVAGESEYAFRHALIRDVAYRQLPRRDRANKHEAAAAWLESLGRAEDHAELLAHHHVAALEFAETAGLAKDDLAERARRSLVAAGERAAAVTAFSSGARHYERALELSASEDPERPLILFAFADALHALGDERQTQALQEAKAALLTVGDKARAAEAEAMLAAAAWLHGRRDDSAAHVEQALSLAHESKSESATARVLGEAARQRLVAGDYGAAIERGREALVLAERAGLDELRAYNLVTIGTARGRSGDPRGIADVDEGLSRALATSSLATAMRAYNNLAILVVELEGDFRRGRTLIEGALELAERVGDRELARFNRIGLARYQYAAGEWDTALEAADDLIAECEAGSIHLKETDARIGRAVIRGARGDVDGALEDIERALTHGRETESAEEHCATLSECIKLCVQLGRFEKAKALVEDLVAVARGTDHGLLSPEFALVAEELGVLDLVRRKLAETDVEHVTREVTRPIADGRLLEAADAATRHEHWALAADIRFRAARALAEKGEQRLAKEQLDQALAFYRSVGATQYIRESEQLLERLRQPTAK